MICLQAARFLRIVILSLYLHHFHSQNYKIYSTDSIREPFPFITQYIHFPSPSYSTSPHHSILTVCKHSPIAVCVLLSCRADILLAVSFLQHPTYHSPQIMQICFLPKLLIVSEFQKHCRFQLFSLPSNHYYHFF